MKIIIPQHRFLRELSLVNFKNTFSWKTGIEEDSYVLGDDNHNSSLTPVFELLGTEIPNLIPEPVQKAFSLLGVNNKNLPIDGVQSDKSMIEHVESAFKCSRYSLEALETFGYLDTFMECNRTLRRLQRACIDINSINSAIKSKEIKNVSIAKGFYPKRDGFLELPEYSITRTLTGRMTITKGPQILTGAKAN